MTEIFPRFSLPAVNFKNRKNRIWFIREIFCVTGKIKR